jgi:hypothetical protein
MGDYVGSAPACYKAALCKKWATLAKVWPTHSSLPKKYKKSLCRS